MKPRAAAALAAELVADCAAQGIKVATAESCTGGMVAAAITDVAGSSAVFDRGFVTYSNDAKMELLGVRATTLQAHGAVSRETAEEMATGALKASRSALAIAVTGIAGPGGGSAEKPVGLVWFACATVGGGIVVHEGRFGAIGRASVREAATEQALAMLVEAAQLAGARP